MSRRVSAWLPGVVVVAIGVVEAAVYLSQGRYVPAVVVGVALVIIGALLSPLAFPRRREEAAVTVYWRPGCVYCLRLRWSLGRRARRANWVDIWVDPDAAATVRGINDGNETVPTVVVGGDAWTNPSPARVRDALAAPRG